MSQEMANFRKAQRANIPTPTTLLYGEILDTAETTSSLVKVRGVRDGEVYRGAATWPTPFGKDRPIKGDICLIAIDDTGKPWVVAWATPNWPGASGQLGEELLIPKVLSVSPYTLINGDAALCMEWESPNPGEFIIPKGLFVVGTVITFRQVSTGRLTVKGEGTMKVESPELLKSETKGKLSTISAHQRVLDGWVLSGDLNE